LRQLQSVDQQEKRFSPKRFGPLNGPVEVREHFKALKKSLIVGCLAAILARSQEKTTDQPIATQVVAPRLRGQMTGFTGTYSPANIMEFLPTVASRTVFYSGAAQWIT